MAGLDVEEAEFQIGKEHMGEGGVHSVCPGQYMKEKPLHAFLIASFPSPARIFSSSMQRRFCSMVPTEMRTHSGRP